MIAYLTASSVLAWIAVTDVDLLLTPVPSEAFLARTGVAALASVGAGGSVLAGFVVGAEVEVLVAEQAAPALLAVALPGLAARPVLAAWVPAALVTGRALPAQTTLALTRLVTEAMALATARRTYGWGEETETFRQSHTQTPSPMVRLRNIKHLLSTL